MNTTITKMMQLINKQQEVIKMLDAKVEELQAKLDEVTSKKEPESIKTVEETIFTFKIDRACKALNMPNFIENLYHLPVSELTEEHKATISAMRNLMKSLLDNDDYGDAVIEGIMELNELL